MILNHNLFESIADAAGRVTVDQVSIGPGYTAVTTSDGGIGIAATHLPPDGKIVTPPDMAPYHGRPAAKLLSCILAGDPMHRAAALALINALNHSSTLQIPEDPENTVLFNRFGILTGARVAMVGYFPPLVRLLEEEKVPLSIIDNARRIGNHETFYRQLESWADVLLLTATSIVNNTTEKVLSHTGPRLKTIILGPSTPMLPAAFSHLPVHMLAGTAITDRSAALEIARTGGGTRELKPFSRKIFVEIGEDPPGAIRY